MKTSRCLPVILLFLLMFHSGGWICATETTSVVTQTSLSKKLINTAGEVLLEAAGFGLDWAGEKFLGTKGWEGFKRILQPVTTRLQEEFPALKFGRPDDPQAAEAAREAVMYLQQDPELQKMLVQGFMDLDKGQQDILASIDRLETLVSANHEEEMEILMQMDETLSHVGQLPKRIDVSDYVDRQYLLSKARARRDGRDFNQNVSGLVAVSVGEAMFTQRVLEEGSPFVRYESTIGDLKWFATPSGRFHNKEGLLCRKLTMDSPVWGEPGKRIRTYIKYCPIEGGWKPVEQLDKSYYFEK